MRIRLAVAAIAFTPFACGDEETTSSPLETPSSGPLVVYEHGGGIAAQPRRLAIDRDGRATLTVQTGQDVSKSRFTLTDDPLSALEDELINAQGDAGPELPTGCADCFTFSIKADDVDVFLDQVSIEDTTEDLKRLVATLERLSGN